MWSVRWAILVLIVGFSLAFSTAGLRHVKDPIERNSTHIPRDCEKSTYSPSVSRPASVTSYSPWRSRLKSVLEETSPRIIVESDLGPLPSPSHFIPFVSSGLSPSRRVATLPLRC